jgi:hypothetical protein
MTSATKIFGWLLLLVGLAIIGWTLSSSYNIFTGKAEIPAIFKIETKETITPTTGKIPTTQAELQKEMGKMIGEQLKEIIPVDTLPKLLNLITWSILAGILIFGGAQISGLGIKLLKK